MKKRIMAFFALTALALSGCSIGYAKPGDPDYIGDSGLKVTEPDPIYTVDPIYNADNEKIGEIEYSSLLYLIDSNIIYYKTVRVKDRKNIDIYSYNIESGESEKLGTIENWSFLNTNNSEYTDGHLYILATTGEYLSEDKSEQSIFDIDINGKSIEKIYSVSNSSIYNIMTVSGGKAYIGVCDDIGTSVIEAFDLKTKEQQILPPSFKYDPNLKTGETIRYITSDEENIYLLRVKRASDMTVDIYIDTYDKTFNFIGSKEFFPDLGYEFELPQDFNLLMQERFAVVYYFRIIGGYAYYENRGMLQCLQKLKDGEYISLLKSPRFKWITNCSEGRFNFISDVNRDKAKKESENIIYSIEADGSIKKASLCTDDKRYGFTYAMCNSTGDVLADLANEYTESGEETDHRLYYFKNSELEFSEIS